MPVNGIAFKSLGAAGGVAEARRYALWFDQYRALVGDREIVADREAPFAARVEFAELGHFGLGRSGGSTIRVDRRREHVSRDSSDRFVLVVNRGRGAGDARDHPGALAIFPGSAALLDFSRPTLQLCPGGYRTVTFHIPRRLTLAAIPRAEDISRIIVTTGDALRLFVTCADRILDDIGMSEPAVLAQAGQTLLDLAALAFGTGRDMAEIASRRGLRAARLQAVLDRIDRDYTSPDLDPETVARRVGISTRYLHLLLQETGASFAGRVQELRLAHALGLLTEEARSGRKISDAAYEAGFNDLSYFNRSFRRKYGLTPTAARGRA